MLTPASEARLTAVDTDRTRLRRPRFPSIRAIASHNPQSDNAYGIHMQSLLESEKRYDFSPPPNGRGNGETQ